VNESDPKLLDLQSALAEVQRLREENVRLRGLLQEHGIQLPVVQSPNGIPVTTSTQSSAHTPVLKAEQRIALFRSLFHGRDDVYAVRWENADGRSGCMPKADRDWKAYLRAKDQDRKKVDRLTRKFRPLTDEVVRGANELERTSSPATTEAANTYYQLWIAILLNGLLSLKRRCRTAAMRQHMPLGKTRLALFEHRYRSQSIRRKSRR